jgi:hypothetical protein
MELCYFHCRRLLHPGIVNVRDETLRGERQPRMVKLILVRELYAIHDAVVCAEA